MPKSRTRWFGSTLRKLHVHTEKVRGVRKDENDALIRLADALAGFVRAALTGRSELLEWLGRAEETGYIHKL